MRVLAVFLLLVPSAFAVNANPVPEAIFLGTYIQPSNGIGIQAVASQYYLILNLVTFEESWGYCNAYSATPASIETAEEYKFVRDEVTRYGKYNEHIWTSGYFDYDSSSYLWAGTGTPVDFGTWGKWAAGFPISNELYLLTFKVGISGASTWSQSYIDEKHYALCKITGSSALTTSTTITTTTANPTTVSAVCSKEGTFPDPTNCHGFYKCFLVSDTFYQIYSTCAAGGYYDSHRSSCVEGDCA